MKKKLKQVIEGQGFICANLDEKERIWQRLFDAGYPMYDNGSDENYKHIIWDGDNEWVETNKITDPLNESDFFDEVDEWTPTVGEYVEVCDDGKTWFKHDYKFIFEHKGVYYCETSDIPNLLAWKYIRPKHETMTLQEVREALGKPNLIITQ